MLTIHNLWKLLFVPNYALDVFLPTFEFQVLTKSLASILAGTLR